MTDKSKIPLPAIAANSGPFKILDGKYSSNYCIYPDKKTNGVLSVPLEDKPDHLAIRLHEYGHLQLISSGFHAHDLSRIARDKNLNDSWFQGCLDVIVNAFLIRRGCAEIANLPLSIPDKNWPTLEMTKVFLRSANLKVESKVKSRVSEVISKEDLEFLREVAIKLDHYSLQAKLPVKEFFSLIRKLTKRFGENWGDDVDWGTLEDKNYEELPIETPGSLIDTASENEINHLLKSMSKKGKLKPEVKKLLGEWTEDRIYWNKWGKMSIASLPLVEAHPTRKNARKIHPGFVGAFRYPHRALLPASDGMAFAYRKKAKGGTILIDCSGSMGLSIRDITVFLNHAPMLTVAAYTSNDDYKTGSLGIFIKNGMLASKASIRNWRKSRSDGNVIDGPAIRWLIKQNRPHVWISDGCVTGINDDSSGNLDLEIMLLKKIGRIKQYQTIRSCLKAFKTGFTELDEIDE